MLNNPMLAIIGAAKNGGNPMQVLQQMAGQNPQVRNFMQMVQGKTPQQLEQMARNMARERGTSVENVIKQLGL